MSYSPPPQGAQNVQHQYTQQQQHQHHHHHHHHHHQQQQQQQQQQPAPQSSAASQAPSNNVNRNSQASSASFNPDDPSQKRLSQASSSSTSKRTKTHIGPWRLGRTLGRGSSGRVRLAKHNITGQLAAVKIVPKSLVSTNNNDSNKENQADSQRDANGFSYGIEREVIIMKLIEHPNVMALYDVWENKGELYLVLEYIEGGELFDYLIKKGRLEEREALHYFRQIINGVDYCHHFNICHRDLKPENLLLDKNRNIKIADFGMAALETSDKMLETSCGSPHYASPEIVSGKNYHGGPSDIWSCGIILFALLTGHLPFDDENIRKLLLKVQAGRFHMPHDLSIEAKDLISRMLCVDPDQRITMPEILNHPLLKKYPSKRATRTYDQINKPLLPMSVSKPVNSREDIDQEILKNLQTLWHGADRETVISRLLSPDQNAEKTFYCLLMKYRHDHLDDANKPPVPPAAPSMSRSSSKQAIKHSASNQHLNSSSGSQHHHHHHSRRSSHGRQPSRVSRHSRTGSKSSTITASSSHKRGVSFSSIKQRTKSSNSIKSNAGSVSRPDSPPPPMPSDAVEMQMQASVDHSQDNSQFSYAEYDETAQYFQEQALPQQPTQIVEDPLKEDEWTKEAKRTSSEFASMLEHVFDFPSNSPAPSVPVPPVPVKAQSQRRDTRVVSDPLPASYNVDPSNLDATILTDANVTERRRVVSNFVNPTASSLDPFSAGFNPQPCAAAIYSSSTHSSLDNIQQSTEPSLDFAADESLAAGLLNVDYLLPMIFEEDDRFADAIEEEMDIHFNEPKPKRISVQKPPPSMPINVPTQPKSIKPSTGQSRTDWTRARNPHLQTRRNNSQRYSTTDHSHLHSDAEDDLNMAPFDESVVEIGFNGTGIVGVGVHDTSLTAFDTSESGSIDNSFSKSNTVTYQSGTSNTHGDISNTSALSGDSSRLRISGLLKTESFKARGSFSNFKTPSMVDIVEQRVVPEYQLNVANDILSSGSSKDHQNTHLQLSTSSSPRQSSLHEQTSEPAVEQQPLSTSAPTHIETPSNSNTVTTNEQEKMDVDGMPKFMESPKMNTHSFIPSLSTQQAQVYQPPNIVKLGDDSKASSGRSSNILRKFSLNPKRQAPAPPAPSASSKEPTSSNLAPSRTPTLAATLTSGSTSGATATPKPKIVATKLPVVLLPTPPPSEPQSRVASGSSQMSTATTAVSSTAQAHFEVAHPAPVTRPMASTSTLVSTKPANMATITMAPKPVSATVYKSEPPKPSQQQHNHQAHIDPSPVKQNWFMKMLNLRTEPETDSGHGAGHGNRSRSRGRMPEKISPTPYELRIDHDGNNGGRFMQPGTPTTVSQAGTPGYKSSRGYYSLLTAPQVRRHVVEVLKGWEQYGVSGIKISDGEVSSNGAKAIIVRAKISSRNALSLRSTRFRVEIEAHELRSYIAVPAASSTKTKAPPAPAPAPMPTPAPAPQQSKNVFKRLFGGSKSSKSEQHAPAPAPVSAPAPAPAPAPATTTTTTTTTTTASTTKVTSILIIQERGSLSTFGRFLKEMEQALEARNAISGTSTTAILGQKLSAATATDPYSSGTTTSARTTSTTRPISSTSSAWRPVSTASDSNRNSTFSGYNMGGGNGSRPTSGYTSGYTTGHENDFEDEEVVLIGSGYPKSSTTAQYKYTYHDTAGAGTSGNETNSNNKNSQGLGIVV
ncbi:uncharacterized protein SAPINGB_P000698 [Magnusiomyces paraingens]|uniref:non-specific serine/threonine protein kinase n=1 Tax=Magnusiomyces paraingens TaxID=2606893 RepID=A0A5E8B910_9ASCO|nr:uncharacterized protein SAPINGB_P000698 [Saprochaete ingens]VVT45282.1 unnamed protein product [Saprochaete ingens]